MTAAPWQAKDFEIALDFLEDHEALAQSASILDTRKDISVILPTGLPALGVRFHGGFMMAPLFIFMAILTWFLTAILWSAGTFSLNRILLSLFALALFFGLYKALMLLCRNRELFPRRHFVTLSQQGVAMHFAHWQLPFSATKTALPWSEVKSIAQDRVFFLPALGFGTPFVSAIKVESKQGKILHVPFHPSHNAAGALGNAIRDLMKNHMRGKPRS